MGAFVYGVSVFKFRNIIILPMILGFVAAGVLAGALGWYEWAVVVFVVGLAATCLLAVCAALTALALALAILYKGVGALATIFDSIWGDLLGGGPGGDDNELEPDEEDEHEGRVIFDVTERVGDPPRTPLVGERPGSN